MGAARVAPAARWPRGRRHGGGAAGHGAAARLPLRHRAARGAAGQPAGAARGGADHVARDAAGGARRSSAGRPWCSPPRSGAIDGPLLAYLRGLARWFGDALHGQLVLPLRSPLAVVAAYALLALAVVALRRGFRAGEPARGSPVAPPGGGCRARAGSRSGRAGAVLTRFALWRATVPPAAPHALTVSFLDVGQGDATLIQDPSGAAVLFDGGPPEARVARAVRNAGGEAAERGGGHAPVARPPGRAAGGAGALPRRPVPRRRRRHTRPAPSGRSSARRTPARRRVAAPRRARRCRSAASRSRCCRRTPRQPARRAAIRTCARSWPSSARAASGLFLSADAESPSLLPLGLPRVTAMKVPHHGSADPGLPQVLAPAASAGRRDRGGRAQPLRPPARPRRSRRCARPCLASTGPTATARSASPSTAGG